MKSDFSVLNTVLFLILAFPSLTFAQALSVTELQALHQQLQGMDGNHELPCPKSNPIQKLKFFFFDGALGYCPRYYTLHTAQKGEDFPDNSITLADRLAQTTETEENKTLLLKVGRLVAEETSVKNCLLVKTVLKNDLAQIQAAKAQLFYYSLNGNQAAVTCAKELFRQPLEQALESNKPSVELRVLGYSMGGDATLQFSQKLNEEGRKIEQVLTVDPVGKDFEWVSGVLETKDNSIFKATPNVGVWNNFYQKLDHGCLLDTPAIHLGIRGSLMQGASSNQELKESDYDTPAHAFHGHVFILGQPIVARAITSLFQ